MNPAETAVILRQFNEWRRGDEDIPQPDPRVIGEAIDAAVEMIDRLEAAEKERDVLKDKIEQMEKQVPICRAEDLRHAEILLPSLSLMPEDKLYALPGAQAQPAKNAVAYLDLGTGGYMDVGTDLTDEELATLPKGRHMLGIIGTYGVDGYVPAQPAPSVPEGVSFIDTSQLEGVVSTEIVHSYPSPSGWLRAIDEALVTTHIGVANAHDTYEQAKVKLGSLIGFHVDVATDPAVNGGFKLMPNGWEANLLIVEHAMRMNNWDWNSNTPDDLKRSAYKIISNLLAAPEAK